MDLSSLIWLLILFVIFIIIYYTYKRKSSSEEDYSLSPKTDNSSKNENNQSPCVYDITKLEIIDNNNTKCCMVGGQPTGDRLMNFTQDGLTKNFIISNQPTIFSVACRSACTDGLTSTGCLNGVGQEEYDSCILLTQPVGCKGTENPIARFGTEYWYIKSWDTSSCSITAPCRT